MQDGPSSSGAQSGSLAGWLASHSLANMQSNLSTLDACFHILLKRKMIRKENDVVAQCTYSILNS